MSALALCKARYIIETEEWKVQPMADNASNETLFANGMSAVKPATWPRPRRWRRCWRRRRRARRRRAAAVARMPITARAAPRRARDGRRPRRRQSRPHHAPELAALIARAKDQKDQAIALLKEAVKIEESMRPPNGAADPVKPSHELLGEVLLRVGKPADAAVAFDACLLRMPNRARSLMGAAQAHAAAGNPAAAAERHATLMTFWKGKAPAAPTSTAAPQR